MIILSKKLINKLFLHGNLRLTKFLLKKILFMVVNNVQKILDFFLVLALLLYRITKKSIMDSSNGLRCLFHLKL